MDGVTSARAASCGEWQYFSKQDFRPSMRRRKLIGRRQMGVLEAEREVRAHLRINYADLVNRVVIAFDWLRETDTSCQLCWQPWETEKACIYLVPVSDSSFRLHRCDRHFDETFTPDGAGLCATEFAIEWLAQERSEGGFCYDERLMRFGRRVLLYSEGHPERAKLSRVID